MNNYYAVLGIDKKASKDEITKAYRRGAKAHHPDVNPGDADAARRFQEIQEAYDVLSDSARRADYDSGSPGMSFKRRDSSSGFGNPFADMMNDMFGKSQFRGRNHQVRLEIDLEEAVAGCNKEVTLRMKNHCKTCKASGAVGSENCSLCNGTGSIKVSNAPFEFLQTCSACMGLGKINPQPCSDCSGTGSVSGIQEKKIMVSVPTGVDSGMTIRLPGQGEESVNGGRNGDVVVFVVVRDHPLFTRDGVDLSVDMPTTYTQLALGAEVTVSTIFGESLTFRVPSGSQTHSRIKLRGKGIALHSGVVGDLYVVLKMETPRHLTEEYKKLLESAVQMEVKMPLPKRDAWKKIIEGSNK